MKLFFNLFNSEHFQFLFPVDGWAGRVIWQVRKASSNSVLKNKSTKRSDQSSWCCERAFSKHNYGIDMESRATRVEWTVPLRRNNRYKFPKARCSHPSFQLRPTRGERSPDLRGVQVESSSPSRPSTIGFKSKSKASSQVQVHQKSTSSPKYKLDFRNSSPDLKSGVHLCGQEFLYFSNLPLVAEGRKGTDRHNIFFVLSF